MMRYYWEFVVGRVMPIFSSSFFTHKLCLNPGLSAEDSIENIVSAENAKTYIALSRFRFIFFHVFV